MKRLTIEQLLGVNKFVVDEGHPHIKVKKELCSRCQSKPCTLRVSREPLYHSERRIEF